MAAVTLYWLKLEYSFESELTVALLYNLAQWRLERVTHRGGRERRGLMSAWFECREATECFLGVTRARLQTPGARIRSTPRYRPIRGQCPGHVITLGQSEAGVRSHRGTGHRSWSHIHSLPGSPSLRENILEIKGRKFDVLSENIKKKRF